MKSFYSTTKEQNSKKQIFKINRHKTNLDKNLYNTFLVTK